MDEPRRRESAGAEERIASGGMVDYQVDRPRPGTRGAGLERRLAGRLLLPIPGSMGAVRLSSTVDGILRNKGRATLSSLSRSVTPSVINANYLTVSAFQSRTGAWRLRSPAVRNNSRPSAAQIQRPTYRNA